MFLVPFGPLIHQPHKASRPQADLAEVDNPR
jgi:hypothetical protein